MKEALVRETIRIKPSTKMQLEREACKLGIPKSEYERMKLESPLKPRAIMKRKQCIEKVQRTEMKNQVRDYMKSHNCDDELACMLQNVLKI